MWDGREDSLPNPNHWDDWLPSDGFVAQGEDAPMDADNDGVEVPSPVPEPVVPTRRRRPRPVVDLLPVPPTGVINEDQGETSYGPSTLSHGHALSTSRDLTQPTPLPDGF
ncbi:hypothetical protein M408DRAFT_330184 [Serendipita vermifera MAFF 305830]|uniref:Uncharacterized protein n=1 Tax=Serendipita vermifera MAFF 305830 TaxID=933852 RepID=A0A0C2WLX1_SERVB|nr:hypothetical protein M408DRAFT_330184 [Serendipita vermifera MAFF 305830]